jgi:hypothetical protein
VRKASLTIVEAIFWSKDNGEALFAVFEPFNKEKATVGNGSMVGFQTVDKRKELLWRLFERFRRE